MTLRIVAAARAGNTVGLLSIKAEIDAIISSDKTRGTLAFISNAVGEVAGDLRAGRDPFRLGPIQNTSGGQTNPLGGWINALTFTASRQATLWEELPGYAGAIAVAVGASIVLIPATKSALACAANPLCRNEATAAIGEAVSGASPGTFLPLGAGVVQATKGAAGLVDDVVEQAAARVGAAEAGSLVFDKTARTWTSPGGLVYGKDTQYGNRMQHVLAHTAPNPGKPAHSVFNVGREQIVGLLDEAWALRGNPLPNDRAVYVVPMGRVVGMGGETSIRLVVRPGTSEVITGYPVR